MATFDKDHVVDSNAIRDTNTHNSNVADIGEFTAETVVVYNGLNQQVTIQLQGSLDETTWIDVGNAFNVPATTNDYETVTDYFPCYRCTATCSTAPTTGDLDVWILKAGAVT
jgi:hypothetical protein